MSGKKSATVLKRILAKNLNLYIDRSGKNQTDIARELGIPEMTMSNWVKAKTYPRADKVQLLADYFRINRYDLTEEMPENIELASPKTVLIPVLGEIACGDPITAEENIIEFREELEERLPSGELFYLKSKGNSMLPTIPDNSYVLIKEQPEVEYGEIAAVLVNDDTEATLKRVKKQGDIIMLVPDNNEHEPYIITKDNPARILGKAIRYTQDL